MLAFRGKGSKAARLQAFCGEATRIISPKWRVCVQVVATHKVLGVRADQGGSMAPEIMARISGARQALKPIRATVAKRQALSQKAR
eukprot:7505348-Pyramimonas_sp.AAC.1